jgi:hypothetical protein
MGPSDVTVTLDPLDGSDLVVATFPGVSRLTMEHDFSTGEEFLYPTGVTSGFLDRVTISLTPRHEAPSGLLVVRPRDESGGRVWGLRFPDGRLTWIRPQDSGDPPDRDPERHARHTAASHRGVRLVSRRLGPIEEHGDG